MRVALVIALTVFSFSPVVTEKANALPIPWCTPWGPCTPPCAKNFLPIPTCTPGTPCVPWPQPCSH
jgi:hypothetical protein